MILLRVLSLVGLTWIPGRLVMGLACGEGRDVELLELTFQSIGVSLTVVGLWGTLLACIGHFRPVWVGCGVLLLCSLLIIKKHTIPSSLVSFPRFEPWHAIAVAGIAGIALLFAPPHENVIVGRDPGVYTNTAIHVARTGKWIIRDSFFSSLPPLTQDSFLSYVWQQGPFRLPGFFWLPRRGVAVSQFLPFYTVWMAMLEWVLGPGGGGWAALLFSLTGCLGLLSLAARFWKPRAALFLLPLLVTNPATIWYARSSNSEVALQVLILLAVSIWGRRSQYAGWLGPLLIVAPVSAALLDKLDALYLVPFFYIVLGYAWAVGRDRPWFRRVGILTLFAVGALAAYVWRFGWPYFWMSFRLQARGPTLWSAVAGVIVGFAGLSAIVCLRKPRDIMRSVVRDWGKGFAGLSTQEIGAGIALLAVAFLVLYFVLPMTVPPGNVTDRRLSLVRVGWYVTPVGLLLSGFGGLSLFGRKPPRGAILFLLLTLGSLFVNLALLMVDHIFGIRRFVAVAIPGLLLLGAGALDTIADWRPKGSMCAGKLASVGLGLTMVFGQAWNSRSIVSHREFEGAQDMLHRVGGSIPSNSLVAFPDHDSLLGTFLGPNLWLSQDLETLYASDQLTEQDWRSLDRTAEETGRLMYVISEREVPILSGRDSVAVERIAWSVPYLEQTYERFPREIGGYEFAFTIWEMAEGDGSVRYEPGSLLSQIGKLTDIDGHTVLVAQGSPGYLCYGPYHEIPPGRYVARFGIVPSNVSSVDIHFDVTCAYRSPVAQRSTRIASSEKQRWIDLPFVIEDAGSEGQSCEFRVLLPNGGSIGLSGVEIISDFSLQPRPRG